MSRIKVVGALIKKNDKILIAQRGYGPLAGKWEFPGGKVENGETNEEALSREIQEELGIKISVENFLCSNDFEVNNKELSLYCYWSKLIKGAPQSIEHKELKWVPLDTLLEYDLAPADIPIAKKAMNDRN